MKKILVILIVLLVAIQFITIDKTNPKLNLANAKSIIAECRMIKSSNEIGINISRFNSLRAG